MFEISRIWRQKAIAKPNMKSRAEDLILEDALSMLPIEVEVASSEGVGADASIGSSPVNDTQNWSTIMFNKNMKGETFYKSPLRNWIFKKG